MLGDEAVESSRGSLAAGQAEAFPFRAGVWGVTGTAYVYLDSRNAARALIVGLYTSLNNQPGSLLTTGSLSSPRAGAWNAAALAPAQLVAGTTYWLAVLGTGATLRYRDRWRGPCQAKTSAQTGLLALASRWSTGASHSTCPISAYVIPATTTLLGGPLAPVEPTSPAETTPPTETPPPAPPAAPTNSTVPTVGGTATEGQTLIATTGAWTGNPTSYSYQWQDCNSSGASCVNVIGASGSSYSLVAGDVGHTLRVVVTASNASGSSSAGSAATAVVVADPSPPPPPPPAPPTASFTYSPTSPVTGQAVTFNGASSTCPDGPCVYEWSDDGGTTRPIPALWPLGTGQTMSFTFSGAGTKYARLVVTDAAGQTATVEHNVVVAEVAPPPPTAPLNTALPSIGGSAVEGETLSASAGTWSGSPTSFAYQWQDCNTAGESCSNVSGATSSSYRLLAGDVGHTLRVVVSASNAGGSTAASSAATAVVVAEVAPPPPPPPPSVPANTVLPSVSGSAVEGQTLSSSNGSWSGSPTTYGYRWQDCNTSGASCTTVSGATGSSYTLGAGDVGHTLRVTVTASNAAGFGEATSIATTTVSAKGSNPSEPVLTAAKCFENPEEGTEKIEACGYPGKNNTGPEPGKCCTKTMGAMTFNGSNTPVTIEGARIEGQITILPGAKNVHLINDEIINTGTSGGEASVRIERGAETTGANQPTGTIINHDRLGGTNPTTGGLFECLISYSAGELHAEYDSFRYCGGIKPTAGGVIQHDFCDMSIEHEGEHSECLSDDGDEPQAPLIVKDNTFFNPKEQTASIFLQGTFFPVGEVTIEDNFVGGGGDTLSLGSGADYGVRGPEYVKNNRLARACPEVAKEEKEVGYLCSTTQKAISGSVDRYELCTTKTSCSPIKGLGYYARSGYYNAVAGVDSVTTWSGNFWDDNMEKCNANSPGKSCYGAPAEG